MRPQGRHARGSALRDAPNSAAPVARGPLAGLTVSHREIGSREAAGSTHGAEKVGWGDAPFRACERVLVGVGGLGMVRWRGVD